MIHTPTAAGWRFAPTGGGAEHGNNAGQHYFSDEAVVKATREIVQNSIDHAMPDAGGINLHCKLLRIPVDTIGISQLQPHIKASLQEVSNDQDQAAVKRYTRMLQICQTKTVPCLAFIDSGTTGLIGNNLRNLIFREGTPTNTTGQAKGGSFGFGKNAPYNLSVLNTVFYSTFYVERKENGRVESLVGKTQLVTHDDPRNPDIRLQQTGFYGIHAENQPNRPLAGKDIPTVFRLNETGTGIFIIGFDVANYPNWAAEIIETVTTQFWAAVAAGTLTVTAQPDAQRPPIEINRENLPVAISQRDEKDPTRHYWKAYNENPPETTEASGQLQQMGKMKIYVSTEKGAPNRVAHINRRGMLITTERQSKTNPFYPYGGAGWTDWCAVTVADDETADQFIRRMEPPAHDAVQVNQIQENDERKHAEEELKKQRAQIREIVRKRIEQGLAEAGSNVKELAELFPDAPTLGPGTQALKVNPVKAATRQDDTVPWENTLEETEIIPDENGEYDTSDDSGQYPKENKNPSGSSGKKKGSGPDDSLEDRKAKLTGTAEESIRHASIIKTSPQNLKVTFTTPPTHQGPLQFRIKTAGEQYQKRENTVAIKQVTTSQDSQATTTISDNAITVNAPTDTVITMEVTMTDAEQPYLSYAISQMPPTGNRT